MAVEYNHLVCCSDRSNTFATLGFLHWYQVRGRLSQITRYSCCGSGAIICTLLASGANIKEIVLQLIDSDIFESNTTNLRQAITNQIGNFFSRTRQGKEDREGKRDPTLLELYNKTGNSLEFHVYNTTNNCVEIFSHITCPSMSIATACCFCYNIPYTGHSYSYCGSEYIDSSVVQPIPNNLSPLNPTSIESSPLIICSLPDIRAVSTFVVHKVRSSDGITNRIFGRQETFVCAESTSATRMLCTAYYFSCMQQISSLFSLNHTITSSNINYVSRNQVKANTNHTSDKATNSSERNLTSANIKILLVPFSNTSATKDQRYEMLARWKDYEQKTY